MEETTKQIYDKIVEMYSSTKKPIALWQLYQLCKKDGFGVITIRNSLKWLFEHGYLEWTGEEKFKPR